MQNRTELVALQNILFDLLRKTNVEKRLPQKKEFKKILQASLEKLPKEEHTNVTATKIKFNNSSITITHEKHFIEVVYESLDGALFCYRIAVGNFKPNDFFSKNMAHLKTKRDLDSLTNEYYHFLAKQFS